jgi:hypothetical protein
MMSLLSVSSHLPVSLSFCEVERFVLDGVAAEVAFEPPQHASRVSWWGDKKYCRVLSDGALHGFDCY